MITIILLITLANSVAIAYFVYRLNNPPKPKVKIAEFEKGERKNRTHVIHDDMIIKVKPVKLRNT